MGPYGIYFDSTRPHLPSCTIQGHHWLHLDHQEAQEGPTSGYFVEIDSLDGLFHTNLQGIVCFWNPCHHTYLLIPFGVIFYSFWTVRKHRKLQNLDIWWKLIVLMDFFILIWRVLYVFGILGTIPTYSYHLEPFLTPSGPSGSSGSSKIGIFGGNG